MLKTKNCHIHFNCFNPHNLNGSHHQYQKDNQLKYQKFSELFVPISLLTIFFGIFPVIPSSYSTFHYEWAELDPGENNHIDLREKYDPDNPPTGPYFEYEYFRNETVMVGNVSYLRCRVKNIANLTVSWVRHMDINLLSVGTVMYTSDGRFQSMHDADVNEWTLKVKKRLAFLMSHVQYFSIVYL